MGIEPTSEAWEAPVLPLNYARSLFLIVLANYLWVQAFDRFIESGAKAPRIGFRKEKQDESARLDRASLAWTAEYWGIGMST